jgi:cytochrome c biogenesis protein CcdA/thiol-disulfide isomerase/thioredoxin
MILLIVFAFLAGVITILSPCILPVLPIILTSSIGGKDIGKSRPIGVTAGFVLSFTFFTLFLSTIVRLSGIPAETLRIFSVLVIAGFGLSLLVPKFQAFVEQLFAKTAGFAPQSRTKTGFTGGFVVGLSIGLLWTPCVGPILASVISLAIIGTVTFDAFLITLAYSLGTAIPMFLIIRGGQGALKRVPWLLAHLNQIQKIFGILMILTAIGIYFNVDRKFQTFVLETFPQYGSGLTKLEDNTLIKEQLNKRSKIRGIKAPEIIPGGEWFNSDPLTLASLKGKVVLIDFWTYSCINCQRTFPYLREWWEKYKDKGLVIIGVHSPEFEFEKVPKNVAQAIKDFQLAYPVVQDNNFSTWRAYDNNYWPAKYFVDKEGNIRSTHFGEGEYDESERIIRELLLETGADNLPQSVSNPQYQINARTPELYLGFSRSEYLVSNEKTTRNKIAAYSAPTVVGKNLFAFTGDWKVTEEYANPQKDATLILNFESKEVHLVMRTAGGPTKVKVFLDGKLQETVIVDSDKLYKLIELPTPGRHLLRLEFEDENAELYAFTFG